MANTQTGSPSGGGPHTRQTTGVVDIAGEGDLAHWLKVFDTTHEKLLEAIDAVGRDAAAVSAYLKRGSDSDPPPAGPYPDGG
jgi:hypothetical protein